MFDLMSKRRYGYLLSAVVTITSLIFIFMTLIPNGNVGLSFSIAYTGGTIWEVHFEEGAPEPADVHAVLEEQGLTGSDVAITGADEREYVLIRTEALTLLEPQPATGPVATSGPAASGPAASGRAASAEPDTSASPSATSASPSATSASPSATSDARASAGSPATSPSPLPASTAGSTATPSASTPSPSPSTSAAPLASVGDSTGPVGGVPTEGRFGDLAAALQERFGPIDEVRQQNSVGPVVSNELVQQTFLLILFASAAIMGWITYRFRDFRMGVGAIVALLHDVIVVLGAFALMGTFLGLQIDALFVTAMLTVIGFSVHDTIVVFDRIRENRQRYIGEPLEAIVNYSIMQTLGRSITTSLTLIVTLVALILFGSEAIRPFGYAMLIGVITGTYSSIIVATPIFLDWHLRDDRRKVRQLAQASPA